MLILQKFMFITYTQFFETNFLFIDKNKKQEESWFDIRIGDLFPSSGNVKNFEKRATFLQTRFPQFKRSEQPASASHSCVFCAASWMQNVCKIPECHPKNPHWHFPASSTIEFLKIALPWELEYFAETCFFKFHELLNCKKFTYF